MADEERVVRMPPIGESITEGVVAQFLKRPGDPVRRDEVVLEIETDKATIQVVAPEDGVIASISEQGAVISVGEPVYTMRARRPDSVTEQRAPQVVRVPALGESVTEVVVAKFLKRPGDRVRRDEAVLEVEMDKCNAELVAPDDGVIASISAEGAVIKIGEPVYTLLPPGAAPKKAEKRVEAGPGLSEWRQAWDVRHVQRRASQLTAAGTTSGPAEAALFATALVRALAAVPVLLGRVGQGQPREVALEVCEVGGTEVRWSNLSIRPDELIHGALAKLKPGRRIDARVKVVRLAGAEIEAASTTMSGAVRVVIGPTRTEAVVEGGAIVARPRATLTVALGEWLAAEQVQAFAAALAEQLAAV